MIILKGVTIGDGFVVADSSVVTKSVTLGSLSTGNPVRIKKDKWMERLELITRK